MRTGDGKFKLNEKTKKSLGSVTPSFGLSRFGNAGATSRSGHERNRLFLSRFPTERQFTDISGISGTDSPADSRAVAFMDYDRDGWSDMVVVNANAPLTQLFRNQLGSSQLTDPAGARTIAVRLIGGNHTAQPSAEWSSRDGYGARLTVQAGASSLLRTHRAGEGLAAQNSATLLIGIGSAPEATLLEVRWPSGRSQELTHIPAGTLVTVFENPAQGPDGGAFVLEPYLRSTDRLPAAATDRSASERLELASLKTEGAPSSLRMFVTMATWCESCLAELPELEHLRASFAGDALEMFGIPADEEDTSEMLVEYAAKHQPAYELQANIDRSDAERVQTRILDALGGQGLPATIVTDAEGHVLLTRFGAPSVSELRRLLAR